jgi:hypothetical protein
LCSPSQNAPAFQISNTIENLRKFGVDIDDADASPAKSKTNRKRVLQDSHSESDTSKQLDQFISDASPQD